MSFIQTIKSYNPTFWVANFLQIIERGAWFGVFSLLGLYLVASTDEGGLGLSHIQKGNILANVTAIQFFLPLFFGVIADRIGYKLSLIIAFVIIGVGYYLMGTVDSYWAIYLAFLFAAMGGSFFKPVASGIIARTTDEKTSTMGFGLFYLMANIGGFFGPAFSSYLRTTMGWRIIFLQGAAMILVNLLVVLFFYKEKKVNREYNVPILDEIKGSFHNIIEALKAVFAHTSLVDTAFQFLPVGVSHGHTVFLFDYPAGSMSVGGGGGLAYFLAVEITLLIAQVINFFAQRNVTFKSNSSMGKAAFWYAVAYVVITIAAAALQVLYKDPIYASAIATMGAGGETFADVITMIINAAISFWVFFPIFKVIFKQEPSQEDAQVSAAQ